MFKCLDLSFRPSRFLQLFHFFFSGLIFCIALTQAQAQSTSDSLKADRPIFDFAREWARRAHLNGSQFQIDDGTQDEVRKVAGLLVYAQHLRRNAKDSLLAKKIIEETNRWIQGHLKKNRPIGTTLSKTKDYDFELMQWAILLHGLGQDTSLIYPATARTIVFQGLKKPPHLGNKRLPLLIFRVPIGVGTLAFPETENHVLMSATWTWLINQWIVTKGHLDPELNRYRTKHLKSLTNKNSILEDQLLSVLARFVQNGYFETNARAYQSFSGLALLALASFSAPGPVLIGANAALEYTLVRLIYQSHLSVRYPPARRNWTYRDRYGLLQNDYLPLISWVIGFPAPERFITSNELLNSRQWSAFGMWTTLCNWQAPPALLELAHTKVRDRFHFYTRAQSRYTHRHYLQGKWPRYSVDLSAKKNKLGSPDLSQIPPIETPEFYWGNSEFTLSAGGAYEPYKGIEIAKFAHKEKVYDFFSRPTLLISQELANFSDPDEAKIYTLVANENAQHPYYAYNTGVYKNILFAQSRDSTPPISIPFHWIKNSRSRMDSSLHHLLIETDSLSPVKNYYLYVIETQMSRPPLRALVEFIPKNLPLHDLWEKLQSQPPLIFNAKDWQYTSSLSPHIFNIHWSKKPTLISLDLPKHFSQDMPLLEVSELSPLMEFTGNYYARAFDLGRFEYGIGIKNKRIWDWRDYRNPLLIKP